MDGVQLPQGQGNIEEAVYFLPLSFQKFRVLILSNSKGWKAKSTLESPSGFEPPSRPVPLDWEPTALITRRWS